MVHLIDKDALVAEIERLKNTSLEYGYNTMQKVLADSGKDISLRQLQNFIDILEVKEVQEEPVSEDLEEACEQLAENARKYKAETSSPFFSQTDYKQGVMDGAKWQFERVNEALLSEVLPCFIHGGEADEVVAKLDEVLNKKNK
jgi:hypothetical protein